MIPHMDTVAVYLSSGEPDVWQGAGDEDDKFLIDAELLVVCRTARRLSSDLRSAV